MNLFKGLIYHVWRSTCGRPQFLHLADTPTTLNLFTLTFAITTLSCALVRRPDVAGVALGAAEWTFWMIYLPIFFVRKSRSRVLLASGLAGLAGVNVLTTFLQLVLPLNAGVAGILDLLSGVFRLLLLARLLDVFLAMPAYIQKTGYSPHEPLESRL